MVLHSFGSSSLRIRTNAGVVDSFMSWSVYLN